MKRFCCFLLFIVLLPIVSLADLPDITNLTRDELLQLSYQVQNLLFEKTLPDGVLLPAGEYIVGADIPAGEYRADAVSDVGGRVAVYRSKEDAVNRPGSYIAEYYLGDMWGTLVFRLVLEEGNYITIKYNSLKLYPFYSLEDLSVPKQ